MQIPAIQGNFSNSTKGIQTKKYSTATTKDLTSDSFSKEKTNKVAFKGFWGAFAGGMTVFVGGVTIIATGGLAAVPALLATYGTLAATGAGAVAGYKAGEILSDSNKKS